MARMFVYFNVCSLAVGHYNKSKDIPLEEDDTQYEPLCDLCLPLVQYIYRATYIDSLNKGVIIEVFSKYY